MIGFDELVGAHGGLGGPQTQPFLIYPTGWTDEAPKLVGSVDVHHFLKRHTSESPHPRPLPRAREGEGQRDAKRAGGPHDGGRWRLTASARLEPAPDK